MMKQVNGNGVIDTKKEIFTNDTVNEEETSTRISEWKAAVWALCLSLVVLTVKTVHVNKDALRAALWDSKFTYIESLLPDGRTVGYYFQDWSFKSKGIAIPFVCGLIMTIFTWSITYMDSYKPGVYPPTPFSPKKSNFREESRRTFHLGYIIALVNGFLVFIMMVITNAFSH